LWTTLRITIPRSCNMPGWLHFHVPEFSKLENRPTNDTDWLSWLMGWCGGSVILCEGFMTMHVCHCGPGGRWWRAHQRVHDYACVSLWAWWEVVAAHQRVHDYACVSLWAWWEVVAAHQRVHDYACCHLQADCSVLRSPTLNLRVWYFTCVYLTKCKEAPSGCWSSDQVNQLGHELPCSLMNDDRLDIPLDMLEQTPLLKRDITVND